MSSKAISDLYPRRGSMPAEVVSEMYTKRDLEVAILAARAGTITIEDIQGLERYGRTMVAQYHWSKCAAETQLALLGDSHHWVRSAALLSQVAATRATSGNCS